MYYERGMVTLQTNSGSLYIAKECDLEFKYKKRVKDYDDINGVKRWVRDGYDLTVSLRYVFNEDEYSDETELRDIINYETIDYFFLDILNFFTDVQIYIKKEEILDLYDVIEVEIDCGIVEEVPRRSSTPTFGSAGSGVTPTQITSSASSYDPLNR